MSLLQEWKIRRAQAAAQRMIDERDAEHATVMRAPHGGATGQV
jgi:hypothetical protein